MFAKPPRSLLSLEYDGIRIHRAVLLALSVTVSALTTMARADQVVLPEKNFPAATILGLEEGKVRFQTGSGNIAAYYVDEISWMIVAREGKHDDFNQAERFLADGKPDAAIERYRRALRTADDSWSDLIQARLLVALNRTDRLVDSIRGFIVAGQSPHWGSALAARLMPEIGAENSKSERVEALRGVTEAVRKSARGERRILLEMLRFELLRATGDARMAEAALRVDASMLERVARTPRVYRVQSAALRILLDQSEPPPETWPILDQSIRLCPESMLPEFLMLKGKTMTRRATTDDDLLRACWSYLRIVAHTPRDPLAADALYEAAVVHRQLGREHRAVTLLDECIAHKAIKDDTRLKAEALLADLSATVAPRDEH